MARKQRVYTDKNGEPRVKRRRMGFKRWYDLRFKVWCRDEYRCVHCGERVPFRKAHIDHIIPVSRFGTDKLANLRCLCIRCHALRADSSHDKLRREAFDKGIIPRNFHELLWDG